jgi:predicted glycosyltransferase
MTRPIAGRPRLLIYSQDGLGLGHLRRTTLLASEFLARRPDGAVLTICDSPTGQFFAAASGHDYLKLPSIRKMRPGEWSPVSLSMPFDDVLELRKELTRTAAVNFAPDVFLVDHMPHGSMGELVPTLEALEHLPVKKVLGLRDILDAPETIHRRWRLEGAFEAVERHYQEVVVYGSRDVFDVAAQYGWPSHLQDRLHYCGYVCAPAPSSPASRPSRRHVNGTRPDHSLIVAMAGGGADAFPLFDTLVRAMPSMLLERSCSLVLVTGPFLPQDRQARLRRQAEGLPIEVLSTVNDPLSLMAAADFVVTMAGYNTTAELLRVEARALLVPRPGPSAEQQMRAARLAERGWVRWLPPESLSAEALATAVLTGLDQPTQRVSPPPDLRGLERAARHLTGDFSADTSKEARPTALDSVLPAATADGLVRMVDEPR